MTKLDSDTSGRSTLFPGSFFFPGGTLRTLQFMRVRSDKIFAILETFFHVITRVTRDLNVDYLSFPTFSLKAVLPLCLLISDAFVAFEDLQLLTLGFTLIVGKEPTVRSA